MKMLEYIVKNNETYRGLSKKIGISHSLLWRASKYGSVSISKETVEKIHNLLPDIDVIEKSGKYYLAERK
jgi:hypothetical protein